MNPMERKVITRGLRRSCLIIVGTLVVVIALMLLARLVMPKVIFVSGVSMEPTLPDGSILICSTATSYEHNAIYALNAPDGTGLVVKRLIGLPGDTVTLVNGDTFLNGEYLPFEHPGSWDNDTFTLGEDEYFFLGDNRKDSYDGRYWPAYVHSADIKYRAQFIYTSGITLRKVR